MGMQGQNVTDVTISVVVNTCDRRDALRTLLYSLNHQSYPKFEVIVVVGPTQDDSEDMVRAEFGDRVHLASCPHFNLSCSRNVGLAHAAGDVVAFIDDDSVASRHWLGQLAEAYRDAGVSGAGGRTYNVNPGAASLQFLCGIVSVLAEQIDVKGRHDERPRTHAPERWWFPRFHGTNMSYRRQALLSINGFDERFEYLFDDADIAVRLGRAGCRLEHLEEAVVYHFPGTGRNRGKHPYDLNWYCWLRSTVYFALKNGSSTVGRRKSLTAALRIISWFFSQLTVLNRKGKLPKELYKSGRRMLWKGSIEGLFQGLFSRRRIPSTIEPVARLFTPFKRESSPRCPSMPSAFFETREEVLPLDFEPLCIALLVGKTNDIEAESDPHAPRQLASGLAAEGHEVHLIGPGDAHRISFQDGVFIHEIAAPPRSQYRGLAVRGNRGLASWLDFSHAAFEEISSLVINNGLQIVDATPHEYAGLVTAVCKILPVVTRRRPDGPLAKARRGDGPTPAQHAGLPSELDRRTHVLSPPPETCQQLAEAYRGILQERKTDDAGTK